jgi:shikimate dehydrogenase
MSSNTAPRISAHTRTIAIIGDPIEHSLTPRIQNAALREAGVDAVNVAFRVPPSRLKAVVRGAAEMGFAGLMVTIPHKEAVIDLCDELHESARLMGAANLLQFGDEGYVIGHSSDGWAALESLREEGVEYRGKSIVLLGGGGAARSLALTFAAAGASRIHLLNRTVARAEKIAYEVEQLEVPVEVGGIDAASLERALAGADLVVNTTSVGMTPNVEETPLPLDFLRAGLAVYDIVYNPLETRLLREARAAGARPVDGLGMLIYTNVYAVQVCLGAAVSAEIMREEAMEAFAERAR